MEWRGLVRALMPAALRAARLRRIDLRKHRVYRNVPLEEMFDRIYQRGDWGDGPAPFFSGRGSHDPAIVGPYIQAVRQFLQSLPSAPVVVDLGSGDFNVGRQLVDLSATYYACDIVQALAEYNRTRFSRPNLVFLTLNIIREAIPDGDVVIIRQVLQHLSNEHIRALIGKCRKYRYWIVTEDLPIHPGFKPNRDIAAGSGTRLLFGSGVILTEPPFNVRDYGTRLLCDVPKPGGVIRTTLFESHGSGS